MSDIQTHVVAYNVISRMVQKLGGTNEVTALLSARTNGLFTRLEDFHNSNTADSSKLEIYKAVLHLPFFKAQLEKLEPPQQAAAEDPAKRLLALMQANEDRELNRRVMAHVKAVTGDFLPVYANKSVSVEEKAKVCEPCIKAIQTGDFSALQGGIGKGDCRVDPVAEATADKPVDNPQAQNAVPANDDAVAVVDNPVDISRRGTTPGNAEQELADAIANVLRGRLKVESNARVDESAVNAIITKALADYDAGFGDKVKKHVGNGSFPEDRVKGLIEEAMAGHVTRIEFVTPSGEVKSVQGLMHPQVPQIVAWLRACHICWAWSTAGAGKTHMSRQIAEMLEVDPWIASIDPTTTVARIMGYRNLVNGEFVPGFSYSPFKSGGLAAWDEIDTGDPGVIAAANALLSNNHYLFPNNETVEKHANFYCLALGNTKGMGAVAGYTARNKLDAATLDRFPIIEIKYDPGFEMALATGEGTPSAPWKPGEPADLATQQRYVEWVQKVRAHCGESVLVSPRASIMGCKALRCGIPMAEVLEALVFKLVTPDSIKRIKDACGTP